MRAEEMSGWIWEMMVFPSVLLAWLTIHFFTKKWLKTPIHFSLFLFFLSPSLPKLVHPKSEYVTQK